MINAKRIIERFMKYVQLDSETLKEKGFAEILVVELEQFGFDVYRDLVGVKLGSNTNNIIAKRKGTLPGPTIALSAHMDTVRPGRGIEPFVAKGLIRSRGNTILGADDKAGIAAIMEAVETIHECNIDTGNIEVLFTVAEEGGLSGSRYLDYALVNSPFAYVFDSSGQPGEIITGAPSLEKISTKILGTSAHAGICPEEGVNAIQVAARAIEHMQLLRIDNETTANIGSIKGGYATNIVCPEVKIEAEIRSLSEVKLENQIHQMKLAVSKACNHYGARFIFDSERDYEGYLFSEENTFLNQTKELMRNIDIEVVEVLSGAGSDTNNYNQNGIQALNLGIGMKNCHTTDEYIAIQDLVDAGRLALELAVKGHQL